MKPKNYFVPLDEVRREHVVSNSRFIATLAPVFSINEARTFLARIKKEFSDATHNVPAYIIGGGNTVTEYCSDDGEPSGTSGKPALAVLRGSGFGDVAVVITRYFGGTLLGTGGLVKAYTEATQLVVGTAGRGQLVSVHVVMITLPYNLLERIRSITEKYHGKILDQDFGVDITMTITLPVETFDGFQAMLRERSAGKLQAEIIETKEMIVSA